MKVVFFTSVLNHHQLPICLEMYKVLGKDFTVVTTMMLEEQRKILGYKDFAEDYFFCLRMYTSEENYKLAYSLSQECDALIAGVIPEEFIYDRLKKNRLTFRYSERFYKNGFWRIISPRALSVAYKYHYRYRKSPFYLLCAGAFTALDASRTFSYPSKMFKWGYFPEFREYNISELIKEKEKSITKILWAGRFLKWKQPEYPLVAASHLMKRSVNFSLEMIGTGPILDDMIKMANDFKVSNSVKFLGALPPNMVREKMENADIFLFTSNKQEGWGVVLNEAMNSGCAIVANSNIGSVPFLIKNNYNGLIYRDKDISGFCENVVELASNIDLRRNLATKAYKSIKDEWNPEVAAKRLLAQIDNLLKGEYLILYTDGPMSLE